MIIFPSWTSQRISDALLFTLSKHKRVIAKNKEKLIVSHLLKASPFVLQHVLYLIKDGRVDNTVINNHFPISNEEIVHKQLDQLEFKFGCEIVEAVCRYITLSNFGLCETELLDILSCNNDVVLSIIRSSNSEFFRFPWYLWIYLKNEIGMYSKRSFYCYHIVLQYHLSFMFQVCYLHSVLCTGKLYFVGRKDLWKISFEKGTWQMSTAFVVFTQILPSCFWRHG